MNCLGSAAVRVEAGTDVGLGHLRRCLTLLKQLRNDCFDVRVIGAQRFGPSIEALLEDIAALWLEDAGAGLSRANGSSSELWDAETTLSTIGRHPVEPSLVIVDHYGLGEQWERIVRNAGHRVLALDDGRDRRHCADILVGDCGVPFDPHLNSCPVLPLELTGAEFALIDPDFAASEQSPTQTVGRRQLLVSYGGSDPTNETTKALEAIRLLRRHGSAREALGRVNLVLGHANPRTAEVKALAQGVEDVIVHEAPGSLAPLMRSADLFLTSGGNSMVEALAMRRICLVTLTSANQALNVNHLVRQSAIRFLGESTEVCPSDMAHALTQSLLDYEDLAKAAWSRAIFDSWGARRISAAIQSRPKHEALRLDWGALGGNE